jgi:hypothetical protein
MNLCDNLPMRMSIRAVVVAGVCAAVVVAINSPANADTNRAPHSPIASPAPTSPTSSTSSTPSTSSTSSTSSTPGSQGAAPSPTASPATTASPSKRHILTPDQKVALAAAQSSYATAVANARDGFSRAVADAKSVMDQSIAAAGKDKAAIALAKQTFRSSYNQIFQALTASLNSAKSAYQAAKEAINP